MSPKNIVACCLIAFLALAATAPAMSEDSPRIEQTRGVDQSVNYRSLTKFGPWDDRNYRLTRKDLRLLSEDETRARDPIPAFFRVELRREFPHLRRKGEAQYPRAAVPLFRKRYGGLMRDGVDPLAGRQGDTVPVEGEIRLNDILGGNEVTVEINPANPNQVIAGSNNQGSQEMYYSTDGGVTWNIQGLLPFTCCDPTLGWSSDGQVAYVGALSGSIGVSFWRSFDGGQTWIDRVDLTPGGSDKEFLHVDLSSGSPFQDNIYLTYHNSNTLQFARSTDQGGTWDITAFNGAPSGIGSDITTDSAGNIYYFYGATSARQIIMLKSTDGGDTFSAPSVVSATNASFDWPIPAMESRRAWIYAATDADRSGGAFDGSIYVTWTDTTAPDQNSAAANHTQVIVAYSRDGGQTWNQSIPHETADVNTVDRFNQWLTVDENGVVHVVYYDTRQALPNRDQVDLYYTYSQDGGVTWIAPERISTETSANLSDGQEWGDYNGIAVLGDKVIPVWTDNRNGPPNNKDVYAADVVNVTASPNFILSGSTEQQQVCRPGTLDDVNLSVGQIQGFSSPVSLAYADMPSGFVGSFSFNPVTPATPAATSAASVSVDASVAAGVYEYRVVGSAAGVDDRSVQLSTAVFDAVPGTPTLISPVDGADGTSLAPTFTWTAAAQAGDYLFELDDDPAFASIDYSATVAGTTHTPSIGLSSTTTYYWRVRSGNICGDGVFAAASSFTTAQLVCSSPLLAIPDGDPTGISDTLIVGDSGTLMDLAVSVQISHTYVGDLNVLLQHVDSGTQAVLIGRPGYTGQGFGCDGNDIDATLDDAAATPVEDQCGAGTPTIVGTFQPNQPLAVMAGLELAGSWTLRVTDNAGVDLGTLDQWCLLPAFEPMAVDTDQDGIEDSADNCTLVANADQRDADGDGIGSMCDADLNNDCTVNFLDLGIMKDVFFLEDENADLNGSGSVEFLDLGIMKGAFFLPPGPSGVPNDCSN